MILKGLSIMPMLLVIMIGITMLLLRVKFFTVEEVKAFISVVFGFAISCLLFGFLWIVQHKPTTSIWTLQCAGLPEVTPNMDPRGRLYSSDSIIDIPLDRRVTLNSVSSLIDRPPDYENALISSKPISSDYLYPVKVSQSVTSSSNQQQSIDSSKHLSKTKSYSHFSELTSVCKPCIDELICDVIGRERPIGIDQDHAIYNVKPNTSTSRPRLSLGHQCIFQKRHDSICLHSENQTVWKKLADFTRRVSYCQLDVDQLSALCTAPPKYHEVPTMSDVPVGRAYIRKSD